MTNTGRSIRGTTRLLTASLAVLIVVACVEELRAAPVVVRGGSTALVAAAQKKPVRRRSTRRTAARRSTPRQTTITTTTTTTTTTAPGKVDVVIEPRNNNQDAEAVEMQAPPPSREDYDNGGSDTVISGGVLNGKAISKPAPPYPAIAKAARAQGLVTVQVTVDEDGRVISAQAVSGHPLLQSAAVAAAREARFSPTLLSGQPVKVKGVVTYNFVLQ